MVETLPTAGRVVRELRLRAASEESARRSAILFEDALRVASLPDGTDGGRLVIFRRVDLGRIPAHASVSCLALRLESGCRAMAPVVVASGVDASGAEAVVFDGWADAIRILAERWAAGGPVTEWFWARVVPAWRAEVPRAEGWRLLLRAALVVESPVIAAAGVVHVAVKTGRISELLTALDSLDARPIFARCGWSVPEEDTPAIGRQRGPVGGGTVPGSDEGPGMVGNPTVVPDTVPALSDLEISPEIDALFRMSQTPARRWLAWMASVLEVRRRPAGASGDMGLAQRLWRRLVATPSRAVGLGDSLGEMNKDRTDAATERERTGKAPPPLAPRDGSAAGRPSDGRLMGAPNEGSPVQESKGDAPHSADGTENPFRSVRPFSVGTVTTELGGLPFLIPVLQRLGLAEELKARADGGHGVFGVAVLWAVARRVGAGFDDPMHTVLGEWLGTGVSETWMDQLASSDAVRGWVRRARRWCRIEAGIGLASLVRRRARLRTSSTHLEVRFELGSADLRVRRSGLDIDPGWVPWIGRVVRYEYRSGDESWDYDN